ALHTSQAAGQSPTLTSQIVYLQGEGDADDARGLTDMTVNSSVGYSNGIVGQAFDFSSGGSVDAVNPEAFDVPVSTSTFWFKLDDTSTFNNLVGRQYANGLGYTVHVNPSGNIVIRVDTDTATNQVLSAGLAELDDSQWHFASIVHDVENNTFKISI